MYSQCNAYARYGHTTVNISFSEYMQTLGGSFCKVFIKILYPTSSVSITLHFVEKNL
jgi:hypothetical protein